MQRTTYEIQTHLQQLPDGSNSLWYYVNSSGVLRMEASDGGFVSVVRLKKAKVPLPPLLACVSPLRGFPNVLIQPRCAEKETRSLAKNAL